MQLPIEPDQGQLAAILHAVHDDRLDRFLPAAAGSRDDAFRLYLWNCALCEAFYLPLHFAEISVRNAIHDHLIDRFGEQWFDNRALVGNLEPKRQEEFTELVTAEKRRHGDGMTCHHLVSELSFGFWQHLLTKRFHRIIWAQGIQSAFPNLPNSMDRQDLHNRIEIIRKWRNRIAHHKPIFDKGPTARLQDSLQLIRWVCHDVADWVTAASNVSEAVALRPVEKAR
ncbi:MAG: Abi family protein [Alphaproteobacteria bacterium]|nr:Abi family protein [Alphaproteobacteria bacterium]